MNIGCWVVVSNEISLLTVVVFGWVGVVVDSVEIVNGVVFVVCILRGRFIMMVCLF